MNRKRRLAWTEGLERRGSPAGPADLALAREKAGVRDYLMPPLPNTRYTRDTTCWIYGGVTLNPLYWPARHDETLLMKAIYSFHPDFADADVKVWWGDPEQDWGLATLEGGDVMPPGNGVVLIGMSERSVPNQKAIAVLILTAALIVVAVTWIFPVLGVRDSFCNSNPYAAGCR